MMVMILITNGTGQNLYGGYLTKLETLFIRGNLRDKLGQIGTQKALVLLVLIREIMELQLGIQLAFNTVIMR